MIEARSDHIGGGHPFLTSMNSRLRELLEFDKRALDGFPVSSNQTRVLADQRLHADRFGRVEGGVPAGAPLALALRSVNQSFARLRSQSGQHCPKIVRMRFRH